MKLLDPFSGYRLAYGNGLLHLGYFIAIWILGSEPSCDTADYKTARIFLLVSHMTVVVFQLLAYLALVYDSEVLSRSLDTISLVAYQAAIFYTQAEFFVSQGSCLDIMPKLHKWLLIEIITFYSLIGSAILYLFLASLFSFKRGDLIGEENKKADFLTWTEDIYYSFGLTTTLLGVTIAVQYFDNEL